MSKIILNPEEGADITKVQIRGKILFEEPFKADSMVKIENNEVADTLLNLFGFLVELSPEEAKTYQQTKNQRKFKCDKCEFATNVEIALAGHNRKHEKEEQIDKELGIEVIGDIEEVKVSPEEIEKQRQEAAKRHLDSMGITEEWEDDSPRRTI